MPSSACDWSSDVCSSDRSEEHTSELQSRSDLVCRLLLEKKKEHLCTPLTIRSRMLSSTLRLARAQLWSPLTTTGRIRRNQSSGRFWEPHKMLNPARGRSR